MENMINADVPQSPERPKFLTVLCILTFIGSGFGLFYVILSVLGINLFPSTKAMDTMVIILTFLANLLCLLGAVRMWSLYKDGFWVYVVGIVLSVARIFVRLSHHSFFQNTKLSPTLNKGIEVGSIVWVILLYIVFVILYGVNKKHLVK